MINKTVCELFAGVGGFRLGLEKSSSDWEIVWANQWEPGKKNQFAYDCYCTHYGHKSSHSNCNISLVKKDLVPDHNLLVGGFPCQDYSVARTGAKGISGKKGVLWWDIKELLEVKAPKFVLLENVDRLLKSPSNQKGRDFGVMLACFMQLGYEVEWRVINAADYGFAQRRRRVFIFAYKNFTKYAMVQNKFSPDLIIEKSGFFAESFPISNLKNISQTSINYDNLVAVSDSFSFNFNNSGYASKGAIHSAESLPVSVNPTPLINLLESNVPAKFYIDKNLDKWKYLKGAKKIQRQSKSGFSYTFTEGSISFPDSIKKPARTMLTSESTLNRSTHVICDPQSDKLRLITPIEAERIQGFDSDWTNTGMTDRQRYFCMGNALVVGLIERMGNSLNKIFDNEH